MLCFECTRVFDRELNMSKHPVLVYIHKSSRFTPQMLSCERVRVAVEVDKRSDPVRILHHSQLGSVSSSPLSQHGPPLLVQKGVQLWSLTRPDAVLTVTTERA